MSTERNPLLPRVCPPPAPPCAKVEGAGGVSSSPSCGWVMTEPGVATVLPGHVAGRESSNDCPSLTLTLAARRAGWSGGQTIPTSEPPSEPPCPPARTFRPTLHGHCAAPNAGNGFAENAIRRRARTQRSVFKLVPSGRGQSVQEVSQTPVSAQGGRPFRLQGAGVLTQTLNPKPLDHKP